MLFMRIRETEKAFKLDRYRSKDTGFADLLVYAAVVEDGIIVGKNGALMAAWQFCGADTASSTDMGARTGVTTHSIRRYHVWVTAG